MKLLLLASALAAHTALALPTANTTAANATSIPPPELFRGECGGLTGKKCHVSFACVDDPRDQCSPELGDRHCPGVCIGRGHPRCGGITGKTCPPGLTCYQDQRDGCVPEQGGSDCEGLCL